MIKKVRDEKFGPEKPRNRGDREIGGAKQGGLTVASTFGKSEEHT